VDRYYPDIEALGPNFLLPLQVVCEQMANDPLWLERRDCPYGDETKAKLRACLSTPKGPREPLAVVAPLPEGTDKWDVLTREAEDLYREMSQLKMQLVGAETRDQLSFYRTATVLLEKLVALGERSANLRQISDFQTKVLRVFDAVMTPEQRTRATELLKGDAA
jgi:hypothetical protein